MTQARPIKGISGAFARDIGRDNLFPPGSIKSWRYLDHQSCYRERADLTVGPIQKKSEPKDGKRALRASFEFLIQAFLTPDTYTSELYMPIIFILFLKLD